MKPFNSGWMLAIIAALMNIGITMGLIYLQRESLMAAAARPTKHVQQRFWSFRSDDVDALVTELRSERVKLVARQGELDKVAARVEAEKAELEKTRADVAGMRDEISAEIPSIQDSERKNLKSLAQTYAAMNPTAAVAIFHEMDELMCVKLLSLMKPDKVGLILQEMSQQDKDETMVKRAARISDKLRLMKAATKPQS
jgi:flagellar motility protein MotE (MotC chaperone)